jgi:hypothetical protein
MDLPSWARGSRPYILWQARGNPPRNFLRPLLYNLGAASADAKGTTQDYLTHPNPIPVQIMAEKSSFSEVVKAEDRIR